MRRPLTFRLGAALAAFSFAAMGGVTGMGMHSHGGTSGQDHATALEHDGGRDHAAGHDHAAPQDRATSGHDCGHSSHHSSEECTCVGPCQSGAAPTLAVPDASCVVVGETDRTPLAAPPTRLIHQDPSSHLLPLANAPPVRV